MNYYNFHIGDFVAATVHLSPLEELAYRRLLDMYYDTEQPIQLETDLVSRRLRIDIKTVEIVLSEFFDKTENGYRNARCDQEIDAYKRKADQARANGKAGGRPKKTNQVPIRNQEESGSKANQEPRTNNQEPIKDIKPDGAIDQKKSACVKEAIDYLNQVAGTKFRAVDSNARLIAARIDEGATIDQIKAVIDRKASDWPPGDKMRQYLRPSTLFNASKFEQYLGSLSVDSKPFNMFDYLEEMKNEQSR